jgi:hypothetical protein
MVINSSKKSFVAAQKWIEDSTLHFHGNDEHFYIVDSYIYARNKKNKLLLPFRGHNCYANASQVNAVRTLPMFVTKLLHFQKMSLSCNLIFYCSFLSLLCFDNVYKIIYHIFYNSRPKVFFRFYPYSKRIIIANEQICILDTNFPLTDSNF